MKKLGLILFLFLMVSLSVLAKEINIPKNFVLVEGDGNEIKDFYICKYEVTQGEYEELMGKNLSYLKGDNLPVESVTWYDAVMYCNKRSIKEGVKPYYSINGTMVTEIGGNGYRLPETNEWEYAAKGGKKSKGYKYSGSNNYEEVCWYSGNSEGETHHVGIKLPNELGIYDMSGNVWEWTNTESESYRYSRGGSWISSVKFCDVTIQYFDNPDERSFDIGFRVCRFQ